MRFPSQSLESFGERDGDSGQHLLSTGNDQQVDKGMASISQANSTNEQPISKGEQGVISAIMLNRKTWADQVEDVEDDFVDSFQDDNKEEEDMFQIATHQMTRQ